MQLAPVVLDQLRQPLPSIGHLQREPRLPTQTRPPALAVVSRDVDCAQRAAYSGARASHHHEPAFVTFQDALTLEPKPLGDRSGAPVPLQDVEAKSAAANLGCREHEHGAHELHAEPTAHELRRDSVPHVERPGRGDRARHPRRRPKTAVADQPTVLRHRPMVTREDGVVVDVVCRIRPGIPPLRDRSSICRPECSNLHEALSLSIFGVSLLRSASATSSLAVVLLPMGIVSFARDSWAQRRISLLDTIRAYRL